MKPELFHFGPLTVHGYGFMIMLGMVVSWIYARSVMKKLGFSSDKVSELFLLAFAGSYVGGKLFFFFEEPSVYFKDPAKMFVLSGSGFVFYGSFLVSIPLMWWWFRRNKIALPVGFDMLAISGALVHGFGKVGCLLAGCCHGKVCKPGWWSLTFTDVHSSAEPLNQPLYATQIFDALIIFSVVFLMLYLKRRPFFAGRLFLVYIIFYGLGRFITEFYRGDEARGYVFSGDSLPISHSQFISLLLVPASIAIWIILERRKSGLGKSA